MDNKMQRNMLGMAIFFAVSVAMTSIVVKVFSVNALVIGFVAALILGIFVALDLAHAEVEAESEMLLNPQDVDR